MAISGSTPSPSDRTFQVARIAFDTGHWSFSNRVASVRWAGPVVISNSPAPIWLLVPTCTPSRCRVVLPAPTYRWLHRGSGWQAPSVNRGSATRSAPSLRSRERAGDLVSGTLNAGLRLFGGCRRREVGDRPHDLALIGHPPRVGGPFLHQCLEPRVRGQGQHLLVADRRPGLRLVTREDVQTNRMLMDQRRQHRVGAGGPGLPLVAGHRPPSRRKGLGRARHLPAAWHTGGFRQAGPGLAEVERHPERLPAGGH